MPRVVISSVPVPFGKVLLARLHRLWMQELASPDQEEWIQRNEHAHLISRRLLASGCQSKVAGNFRNFGIAEYCRRGMCAHAKDVSVGNKDVV